MVTLADVLGWLQAALDAAQNDQGDGDGTITALSYRRLQMSIIMIAPSYVVIKVITNNCGFSGHGTVLRERVTMDGAVVTWDERDIGIPTGADWLPEEFISWMKGGGSG
jgi:hypothetical protein